MSTILEKDCSQRYVVIEGISISRAFLAIRGYDMIWWHHHVEKIIVLKSFCWTCLWCSSMISSRYSMMAKQSVMWWILQVGWTKPPNPGNWLTEPQGFDRTQFKNHCSRPIPDIPYHPKPSGSVPGPPLQPSQPICSHLRPLIPSKALNTHLRPSSPIWSLLNPSQALYTQSQPFKPISGTPYSSLAPTLFLGPVYPP